jgi:hypothetical protein
VIRTRWHLAGRLSDLSMKEKSRNGWIRTGLGRRYAAPVSLMLMASIGKVCFPDGNWEYLLTVLEWGPYLSERQWVRLFSSVC